MVGSKPQERRTFGKRMKDQNVTDIDLYGLIRQKISSPNQITVPFSGSGSGTTIQGGGGIFLKKEGDAMIGPLAFNPVPLIVVNNTINVDKVTGLYAPRLILLGEGALPDDLETIDGVMFPGQLLNIQAVVTTPITLKDGVGNILTRTGGDIEIGDGQNIMLIFDSISGNWTPLNSALPPGCPIICTENDLGTVNGVVDLDFSLATFHRAVLDGDTTFNIINTPEEEKWQDICLEVQQDDVGGHSVDFVQAFANNFQPMAIQGADRYTSWQIYTYEEPDGTDIFQGFNKDASGAGPTVPGGGGLFQGFAGFIHASLSANQNTNLLIGDHIEFDTIVSNDTIIVTSGAGQASGLFQNFRPGHTYECEVYLAAEGQTNNLNFTAQFFDRNASTLLGTKGLVMSGNRPGNQDSQQVGKAMFQATSLADELEVQITSNIQLTDITSGLLTTEPACIATIKDCGIIESVINQPEPAPEDGELDIREFMYGQCETNSILKRYARFQNNINFNDLNFIGFPLIRNIRIKNMIFNVTSKGPNDRSVQLEVDDVPRGPLFIIPGGFTGVIEFTPLNIAIGKDELVGWSSVGGTSVTDMWTMQWIVWYL